MRRSCPSYSYWQDLKTDCRLPESLLDGANMVLRRFRLILYRTVYYDDYGNVVRRELNLGNWISFLDRVHANGGCNMCQEQTSRVQDSSRGDGAAA